MGRQKNGFFSRTINSIFNLFLFPKSDRPLEIPRILLFFQTKIISDRSDGDLRNWERGQRRNYDSLHIYLNKREVDTFTKTENFLYKSTKNERGNRDKKKNEICFRECL